MSKFDIEVNAKYPSISWTGSSNIHRSLYSVLGGVPTDSNTVILSKLFEAGYGDKLYNYLVKTFDHFEFLVTRREFTVILLDDVLRHLNNLGDSKSESKIVNPETGNVFNLIARDGHLVGGIRFWLYQTESFTEVYFRFRIASIDEIKSVTTTRIKLVCDEALTNLADVGLHIDITEPPQETTAAIALLQEEL